MGFKNSQNSMWSKTEHLGGLSSMFVFFACFFSETSPRPSTGPRVHVCVVSHPSPPLYHLSACPSGEVFVPQPARACEGGRRAE